MEKNIREENAFVKLVKEKDEEIINIPSLYFESELDAKSYKEELIKVDDIENMYVRKVDEEVYIEIVNKYSEIFIRKLYNDKNGDGFICDYFYDRLNDSFKHYTFHDKNNKEHNIKDIKGIEDAIEYMDIDEDLIYTNKKFYYGLVAALEKHTRDYKESIK
jgi:hypothetical protein